MNLDQDPGLLARLERRMQYVLGPRPVEAPEGWRSNAVAASLHLASHPDLNVTTVERSGTVLTLLGFVLDPAAPEDSDRDILERVADRVVGGDAPFGALAPLGGRYVLIVGGDAPMIVGDAIGSLQLFYARSGGEAWSAAQGDLLARQLGFELDAQAAEYFEHVKAEPEYWWPGDSSPYAEVRRLLPNHYLDLRSGEAVRYWPSGPLPKMRLEEVVPVVAQRLRGLIAAGASRFDLALGISAGLDSRLMLAASRDVMDRLVFYTGQDEARDAGHPDVAIPRAMLSAAGATHHVIDNRGFGSAAFQELLRRSVPYAHMHRAPALESQLAHYRLGRVAAIGNISEIARGIYRTRTRPEMPPGGITAEFCARLTSQGQPFAVRQYARWVDRLGDAHGIDTRDILYWENRTGSWFPQNVSEFVIAWQDVFLPYSCRALLEDMLAAPDETRVKPSKQLYLDVIRTLWPELLSYPINPVGRLEGLKRQAYRGLRRLRRRLRRNA